jgi:predicted PhzF superfamily epimerase YddE/YHI9
MLPFRLVDAFTATAFAGNPAGVVLLDHGPIDAAWAQQVASEVRASETAFLHPEDDAWRLRWWTPAAEVDLCGHATLAAAHVLWEDGIADPGGTLRFHTRSGELTAHRDGPQVVLDLPAWPVREHPVPEGLRAALGGTPGTYLGRSAGVAGSDDPDGQPNDVVEVASEAVLRELAPDIAAVNALGSTGLIVTAAADGDGDLVSRYFAPAVGIDEDPVTGSAHSTLGPLWAERLRRTRLTARQISPRGGRLTLHVRDDRVLVGGQAITVIRGELLTVP